MFTIAAVATNVCALPVGTILDYYGPRISGTIGSVLLATGALFLSFAAQLPFDGYIPGYLFLALGGPFVFISSFQLSNAFPNHSGLILALLNGAFDSSSAVFLAYRLLYTASNGAFTPKKFFSIHLIIPVFILVVQVLIMPKESYKNVGELVAEVEADNAHPENATPSPPLTTDREREERRLRHESAISETTSLLGTKSSNQPQPKRHEQEKKKKKQQTSSFQGVLHGRPALEQIRSPWFILITLFTTVQVTRINYFVATIRPQYALPAAQLRRRRSRQQPLRHRPPPPRPPQHPLRRPRPRPHQHPFRPRPPRHARHRHRHPRPPPLPLGCLR